MVHGVEELLDTDPIPWYRGENSDLIKLKMKKMKAMDIKFHKMQKRRIGAAVERWLLYPNDSHAFDFVDDVINYHGYGYVPKARVIAKFRRFFATSAAFEYLRVADLVKAYRLVDVDGTGHLNTGKGEHIQFFKEALKLLLARVATRASGESQVSSSYDVVPYSDDGAFSDSSGLFAADAADDADDLDDRTPPESSDDVFEGISSDASVSLDSSSLFESSDSSGSGKRKSKKGKKAKKAKKGKKAKKAPVSDSSASSDDGDDSSTDVFAYLSDEVSS